MRGFSLIEILVLAGVISFLAMNAFMFTFPAYDHFVLSREKEILIDTWLESRAKSLASGNRFSLNTWTNGYCIKNEDDLCETPVHNLPENIYLKSNVSASSSQIILSLSEEIYEEIKIDKNGIIED